MLDQEEFDEMYPYPLEETPPVENGTIGQSFDDFANESNLECGPVATDTLSLSNGFELCWWGESLIIWSNGPGKVCFELNAVTRPDILKLIDYLEGEYYNEDKEFPTEEELD